MKQIIALLMGIFLVLGLVGSSLASPFVDDFEKYPIGHNGEPTWEEEYNFSDDYCEGGAEVVQKESKIYKVRRAYLWHMGNYHVFFGKMRITQTSNKFLWYSPRLALVNVWNPLERYEVRLYPNTNRVYVKYRYGKWGDENYKSEFLAKTRCPIKPNKWYYVLVLHLGESKWNVFVFGWNMPLCYVEWEDNRIDASQGLGIGVQSAGKYIISEFDEIWAF